MLRCRLDWGEDVTDVRIPRKLPQQGNDLNLSLVVSEGGFNGITSHLGLCPPLAPEIPQPEFGSPIHPSPLVAKRDKTIIEYGWTEARKIPGTKRHDFPCTVLAW